MDILKNKPLLLGIGLALMAGGLALSVIKKPQPPAKKPQPPVGFNQPERMPPSPPNIPDLEGLPHLEQEQGPEPPLAMEEPTKPEREPVDGLKEPTKPAKALKPVEEEKSNKEVESEREKPAMAEIVRMDEKEVVIKRDGKVYVYERKVESRKQDAHKRQNVATKQEKAQRQKQEKARKYEEEVSKEQEMNKKQEMGEKVERGLAIVCSGKVRECFLYEGARPYKAGDVFRGAKIERIDIDRVYLSNGQVLRVE